MIRIAILITLAIIVGGVALLVLDSRQQRMNRQLANAFPVRQSAGRNRSVRREIPQSRLAVFYKCLNYQPGALYDFPPLAVLCIGLALWALIGYVGTFLGFPSLYVSAAGFVVALFAVRSMFNWERRRIANKLFRQLPDVIELVTSTVRAGMPTIKAFDIVSRDMPPPTAGQFRHLCDEMAVGVLPEDALNRIYQRTGVTEYGMFSVTLAVQMKSGGRLAETLQVLAETVRQRVALSARAKALAADAIFSSRALSVAPFAFGGILYLINPELVDMLFIDSTGRILLGYGLASVFCGIFVIRWMVRRGTSL